jgi:hypothetical protein
MADVKMDEKNGNSVNGDKPESPAHVAEVSSTDGGSFTNEDARLVRKIDFHLLPWLCLLYALALIDRFLSLFQLVLILVSTLALRESLAWRMNLC